MNRRGAGKDPDELKIACRQGNPEELPEKVDKLGNGLDRLQEDI